MKTDYRIELTKSAKKEFDRLNKKNQDQILELFHFLSTNPFSQLLKIKKLKGVESLYRIRIVNYRIIYEVKKTKLIVLVIKIGHRKEVYQKL